MAFAGSKLDTVAGLRELCHGDERPFHSCDLESQGAIEALWRAEGRDLLAQVGQARAVGGTVAPSSPLHGRLLDRPGQQVWRGNGFLRPAVDDSLDGPPASLGLVEAAQSRLSETALHRQGAERGTATRWRGRQWIAGTVQCR